MVTRRGRGRSRRSGALITEMLVAMALLGAALLPVAYSISSERRLARAYYQRAVAMEIVDGEMEALAAGEWRTFPAGSSEYRVSAGAATNLPPGHFRITVREGKVRLQWLPDDRQGGGPITRETRVQ